MCMTARCPIGGKILRRINTCAIRRRSADNSCQWRPYLPRSHVGLANRSGQPTDGRRGVSVWNAVLHAVPQQSCPAFFRHLNPRYQFVAVERLRPAGVVFRTQLPQQRLHPVAVVRLVVLLLVQDQPELETRVGATDANAVSLAQLYRVTKTRVLVAVEHRPYLVAFLERILSAPTARVESQRLGSLNCPFRYGVRNPDASVSLDSDQSTRADTSNRIEIGWLGVPALAIDNETPPWLESSPAAPQFGNAPLPGLSSPSHGS